MHAPRTGIVVPASQEKRTRYNAAVLTFSLQSGSNGNAIYVEANGAKLLFDAGISGRLAAERMATHGRDIHDVDALILSHEHCDHVRGAGVYQRMFRLPVYMTRPTHRAIRQDLGRLTDVRYFQSGDTLPFDGVSVHTIQTRHDAADGVAFVVECGRKRLGILTDLGHPFPGLRAVLRQVDAAYLESNYDPQMLETGGYPAHLKARIRGKGGHLSNEESAETVKSCGRNRPGWVAVAHLSEHNNRVELAVGAQHKAVGHDYPVYVAPRYSSSGVYEV